MKKLILWACPHSENYRLFLLTILTVLMWANFLFADQYVVEFKVVDGVKKQVSSYTIPDGETPNTTNSYVLVTEQEYALLGHGTEWDKNTQDWLKDSKNVDKVDLAIANKPKTDKELLAELEAKVAALETAKETP